MAKSQIKVLRTKGDFIEWLERHMLERPPFVEGSQALVDYFHGLIELLVDGVPVSADFAEWEQFLGEFVLAVATPEPTARCGVLAAMALPATWALALQQGEAVSVAQFVDVALINAKLKGAYIGLEKRQGEWWAISQEPFHSKFGMRVRAPLGASNRIGTT